MKNMWYIIGIIGVIIFVCFGASSDPKISIYGMVASAFCLLVSLILCLWKKNKGKNVVDLRRK